MTREENACFICDGQLNYFFSKVYLPSDFSFLKNEFKVDYEKCQECGFTVSKTHRQMPYEKWEQINHDFHHFGEQNPGKLGTNPPRI